MLYFVKVSLTSDILFSKLGIAQNVLIKRMPKSAYASNSRIQAKEFDAFSKAYFRVSTIYHSEAELGKGC